jgi:hypothetical protein
VRATFPAYCILFDVITVIMKNKNDKTEEESNENKIKIMEGGQKIKHMNEKADSEA